jgi:hypothetical protein
MSRRQTISGVELWQKGGQLHNPPVTARAEATSQRGFLLESISLFARGAQYLSISQLINLAPKNLSSVLHETYIVCWLVLLAWALGSGKSALSWAAIAAAYRIIDIISYRMFFVLYRSRTRPWSDSRMRHTLIYSTLNFSELILSFAILYAHTRSIRAPDGFPMQDPIDCLYFSSTIMMTVGSGDFVPASILGRELVLCQYFSMLIFLLLIFPLVLSAFSSQTTDSRS